MFRLYNWRCGDCGHITEELVDVPDGQERGNALGIFCESCKCPSIFDRIISPPAPYMGEKVYNPIVSGGKFDTTGHKRLPKLETLPNGASAADYSYLFRKPEYKEAIAERRNIMKENKEKQKRFSAIKNGGTVNMRVDKCAGDPKI